MIQSKISLAILSAFIGIFLLFSVLPAWADTNFTVTYDNHYDTTGNAPPDASSYTSGSMVTVPDNGNLARTGYIFNGWNSVANGSGTSYAAGDTFSITADITLYPQWIHLLGDIKPGATTGTVSVPNNGSSGEYTFAYTFTATETNTALSFLFRNDPGNFFFDNVSVKLQSDGSELVTNGDFSGGGFRNEIADTTQPASWAYLWIPALGPNYGYLTTNKWWDGTSGAFDGLMQIIPTSIGQTYTLTFTLQTDSTYGWTSTSLGGPMEVLVYEGGVPSGYTFMPPVGTTYSVTYDGNTNTGGAPPTDSPYPWGTTVAVRGNSDLIKTGYTFSGWNTLPNGSGTGYAPGQTFSITADTTLYAQWSHLLGDIIPGTTTGGVDVPNDGTSTNYTFTYTFTATETHTPLSFLFRNDPNYFLFDNVSVKLQSGGSELVTNGDFSRGAAPDATYLADWGVTEQPDSWAFMRPNDNNPYHFSSVVPSYQTWLGGGLFDFDGLMQIIPTSIGQTYTVTFTLQSGSSAGWSTASGTMEVQVYEGRVPSGYTITPPMHPPTTYSVTYIGTSSTGGTAPTDNNSPYPWGTTVAVRGNSNLVKDGYTFSGWNTVSDGSGERYAASESFYITAATTLYAQWTANPTITMGDGPPLSYRIGSGAQIIDKTQAASVADTGLNDLNGGTLTVSISNNGISGDHLNIRNQSAGSDHITVSGDIVSYGGNEIGTVTITAGNHGDTLTVHFTSSSATLSAVQALLNNITYVNASLASVAPRTISFTVSNSVGGTSTSTVTLTPTRPGFHSLWG